MAICIIYYLISELLLQGDVKSWRRNITCGQDETFPRSSSRLSNDDTHTRNSSRASRTSSSDPTPIEKSCSNGRSSTKRGRSSSREGCSVKQARTEKVCHKCETEFDQIFEYESHLVTCYNKIHRLNTFIRFIRNKG